MSSLMTGIPFQTLLETAITEYRSHKSLYYVPVHEELIAGKIMVAGQPVSVPIGPAAGPHTQLAQNLLAGFAAGARVFELKTVQVLEGEALGIVKPCIYVDDEAYNVEWSTELTVTEATEEYIKAYLAIRLFAKEFGWDDNFQFHISVGYNLEGIKSPKIDNFLNTMQDASASDFWAKCLTEAEACLPLMKNVDAAFIRSIDPHISSLVTLSTMHGCPAEEIERIAAYLIMEKDFNTYVKCNPTLIGFEKVRKLLDMMNYGYMSFDTSHFDHDMKLHDAVVMVAHLMEMAANKGLVFGLKLTNTLPVKVQNGELAGEAMYMSGKPLFPLSIHVAKILSDATGGKLPISFSGGIDAHNIEAVLACGIAPVTVATVLLKAGGYKNLTRLAALIPMHIPEQVDCDKLTALCESILSDPYYQKPKPRKNPVKTSEAPPACFKCKNCVDVCPNRANFPLPQLKAAVHIDSYCNECGNCACLCPFAYVPYKDKFTYFENEKDFNNSTNDGFLEREKYRFKGKIGTDLTELPEDLQQVIEAFLG